MPLYTMKCTKEKCGCEFDEFIKLEELDKEVRCPECKEKAERLIVNPKHFKHLSWASWRT